MSTSIYWRPGPAPAFDFAPPASNNWSAQVSTPGFPFFDEGPMSLQEPSLSAQGIHQPSPMGPLPTTPARSTGGSTPPAAGSSPTQGQNQNASQSGIEGKPIPLPIPITNAAPAMTMLMPIPLQPQFSQTTLQVVPPRAGHSLPPLPKPPAGLPTPGPTPDKQLVHPLAGANQQQAMAQAIAQAHPGPQHVRTNSSVSEHSLMNSGAVGSDELMQSGSGSALGLSSSMGLGGGGTAVSDSEAPLPADAVDYAGPYNFEVSIPPQAKNTKSISWTYSTKLNKLFVKIASPCPVLFRASGLGAANAGAGAQSLRVRAMALFRAPELSAQPVRRCPNHAAPTDPWNEGHAAPLHLVRCDHHAHEYAEDADTRRLSVLAPFEPPAKESDWATLIYQFMCFSSCVGGLSRRPVLAVFTLERPRADGSGYELLGRRSVGVRICACPGRDIRIEETGGESYGFGPGLGETTAGETQQGALKSKSRPSASEKLKIKKAEKQSDEKSAREGKGGDTFTLQVRGRENFALLKRIRDALAVLSLLPPDLRDRILSATTGGGSGGALPLPLPLPLPTSAELKRERAVAFDDDDEEPDASRTGRKRANGGEEEESAEGQAKSKTRARNSKRKRPPRTRKAKRVSMDEQSSPSPRTGPFGQTSKERCEGPSQTQTEECGSPQLQQQQQLGAVGVPVSPSQTRATPMSMAPAFVSSPSNSVRMASGLTNMSASVPVGTPHAMLHRLQSNLLPIPHMFDAVSSASGLTMPLPLPLPPLSQHAMFELSAYQTMPFEFGPGAYLTGAAGVSAGDQLLAGNGLDFGQSAAAVSMHDAIQILHETTSNGPLQTRDTNPAMYFSHM